MTDVCVDERNAVKLITSNLLTLIKYGAIGNVDRETE